MFKDLRLFLVFLVLVTSTHCAHQGIVKEPSDEEINAESAKAYQQVIAKSKISTNAKWNGMVKRVASRIAKASGENFKWEYVLIENSEVNAWCMPGGKIAVYTGIMPVLKTEGALAAVLGHEVAHATRRHGKQRYARAMNSNLLGLVIGGAAALTGEFICESKSCKMLTGLAGTTAGIAITFFNLKYSRSDESDADDFGQTFMAKAGYDPSESIKLWERMSAANGGKEPLEILSTHPSDASRRAHLTSLLPRSQKAYEMSPEKFGIGEEI